MNDSIDKMLYSLSKSKFRGSFHLNKNMKEYVRDKGISKIESDAYDFINKRLAVFNPLNDGHQTPMKQVHPVFIAQHACGCCCRGCLERIHKIPKHRKLYKDEIDYIVTIIMKWIINEIDY